MSAEIRPATLADYRTLCSLFDELDDLVEVASDQILAVPGVHHVETSIAVKTVKYNARIAKITSAAEEAGLDDGE